MTRPLFGGGRRAILGGVALRGDPGEPRGPLPSLRGVRARRLRPLRKRRGRLLRALGAAGLPRAPGVLVARAGGVRGAHGGTWRSFSVRSSAGRSSFRAGRTTRSLFLALVLLAAAATLRAAARGASGSPRLAGACVGLSLHTYARGLRARAGLRGVRAPRGAGEDEEAARRRGGGGGARRVRAPRVGLRRG